MSTFLSRITCPILSHKTRDSYCHRGTLQPIQWSASGRPNTSPHNCCVLRLPSPPENSRSWLRLLVSIIIASQTVNPQLFVGHIVFDPSSSSSMDDKPHAGRCAWFTKMLWCRQSGRRWGHCDPAIIVFNGKSYYECDELSIYPCNYHPTLSIEHDTPSHPPHSPKHPKWWSSHTYDSLGYTGYTGYTYESPPLNTSDPGTCPRKRSATATRASAGHSVYQSMVQQFTNDGNLQLRVLVVKLEICTNLYHGQKVRHG